MNRIPRLTLMCAIPRSGKSTWIKNNKNENEIIVSLDEIRKEIFGHQFHAPANPFILAMSSAMASMLLKQGKDVIVDATHLTHQIRASWYPIIKTYKCRTRLVWVYIDEDAFKNIEKCKERNNNSPIEEQVPVNVIDRMAMSFEPPDIEDEYLFNEIIKYKNV
jgi:predicted kinase